MCECCKFLIGGTAGVQSGLVCNSFMGHKRYLSVERFVSLILVIM